MAEDPDLGGAFAKIANANRHLQELEVQIAASGYADAIGFAQQFNPDTSIIEVTLQGVPELPVVWSLMAADCVQNLRCALNYVAWELSRWNLRDQGQAREPNSRTQFPINTRAREFDAYRLPDVHPDHVAHIQRIQPNGAEHLSQLSEDELRLLPVDVLAKRHVLGILVDLTNEDKHRILPRVLVAPAVSQVGNYTPINCEILDTNHFIQVHLENGATWTEFKVRPTGPEPKVDVDDKITPAIQFGAYRVGLLHQVVEAVNHMVGEFANYIV
ncbi:MAG TPA: hypothetical protein VMD09_01800 [Solirubrobacteraceae bacterium]|nr:hypothetical protein [Solirubrobacteraceae bacterium]